MARKIRQDEVTISIIPEDEDFTPNDGMYADGFAESVAEMVDEHGLWGWCSVNVQVEFAGLTGNAYLGGCSYKGEDDFKQCGYYEDMVNEAMQDLQSQVDKVVQLMGE